MKHLAFVLILFLFAGNVSFPGVQAQEGTATPSDLDTPRIEDGRTGQSLTLDELVNQLSQSDVVFLGEQHDNDSGHEFQLNVIKKLVENGHSIAISTEQFERDVQGAVDDYLGGRIDEESFLKTARPWKNYQEHYRPIVEFAKANRIPVIAANIPRRIASSISAGDELDFLDQAYLPRQSTSPKDAYWEKFKATMKGHLGADSDSKLEQFFVSQCLKDDGMAEAITDFIAVNSHEPKIIVHLCGHFHSDFGLGTVSRVMSRRPLTRATVVTMELQHAEDEHKSQEQKSPTINEVKSRAHYICWTVKNQQPETDEEAPDASKEKSPAN